MENPPGSLLKCQFMTRKISQKVVFDDALKRCSRTGHRGYPRVFIMRENTTNALIARMLHVFITHYSLFFLISKLTHSIFRFRSISVHAFFNDNTLCIMYVHINQKIYVEHSPQGHLNLFSLVFVFKYYHLVLVVGGIPLWLFFISYMCRCFRGNSSTLNILN